MLGNKKASRHGRAGTRIYSIWADMCKRCNNPKCKSYRFYGGKGVSVCSEWKLSPDAFMTWADANGYAEHLTIDRINTDGNYEPLNCRWVTMDVQHANKRNNRNIEAFGETKHLNAWSRDPRCEVKPSTFLMRIHRGRDVESAMKR